MADTIDSSRRSSHHPPAFSSNHLPAGAAFQSVFDTSAEALVVVDAAGIIHKANRRARELLRLKAVSGRGASLADFVVDPRPESFKSFWAQASSDDRHHHLDASLASGFSIRITLRATLPGTHFLLLCLEEGSIVQRAEAKSRHLEAELRSVLDSLQVGVILLDPSGHIRGSNARFEQLFGLSRRSIREAAGFEALQEQIAARFRDAAAFSAPWRSYLAGTAEPGNDELELMRPAPRIFERFYRPVLDAEGRSIGWFELYADVTGERQIQAKMLQTEKMAALGQLVSGIAHELNNPLTAIMGYAQLLLGHGLQPSQFAEAKNVYNEAERARRIVKNLLYFARENKPERTRVDVNETVERTIALRSYELRVEDIVVECDLAPGLPHTMADPYQLQQVILNLVVNAEQALLGDRGHGRVWIRTRHLFHGAGRRTGESIVLEVSDDGPGIPPAIASRIFDPFFTTKAAGLGTGLGLSIVYGIVHQHGGEVTFENKPGGGAKFTVELPVVHAPAAEPAPSAPPVADSTGRSRSRRFLVVEDEPTVAQLIVDVLREEGHRVDSVLDSQEGLTRLSRGEYDLVICDLRMPRLDGPAFYDALVRAGSPMRDKIIFITGDTLAPRSLKFLESKNLPYLAKPFLVEELKLAIQAVLSGSHNQPAEIHGAAPDRTASQGT
ncbi:MAG TPA: ATP-binding protein [Candidatus Acidoferrales bacterium]|nr:ATP-binding protein [Candidatus Acidoferrales bacterium]